MQDKIEILKTLKERLEAEQLGFLKFRPGETNKAHTNRVQDHLRDVRNCDIAILLLEYIEILDRVIDSSDTLGRQENHWELRAAADAKQAAIVAITAAKGCKTKIHTNMSDKELRCLRRSACITVNTLAPTVFQFQF